MAIVKIAVFSIPKRWLKHKSVPIGHRWYWNCPCGMWRTHQTYGEALYVALGHLDCVRRKWGRQNGYQPTRTHVSTRASKGR